MLPPHAHLLPSDVLPTTPPAVLSPPLDILPSSTFFVPSFNLLMPSHTTTCQRALLYCAQPSWIWGSCLGPVPLAFFVHSWPVVPSELMHLVLHGVPAFPLHLPLGHMAYCAMPRTFTAYLSPLLPLCLLLHLYFLMPDPHPFSFFGTVSLFLCPTCCVFYSMCLPPPALPLPTWVPFCAAPCPTLLYRSSSTIHCHLLAGSSPSPGLVELSPHMLFADTGCPAPLLTPTHYYFHLPGLPMHHACHQLVPFTGFCSSCIPACRRAFRHPALLAIRPHPHTRPAQHLLPLPAYLPPMSFPSHTYLPIVCVLPHPVLYYPLVSVSSGFITIHHLVCLCLGWSSSPCWLVWGGLTPFCPTRAVLPSCSSFAVPISVPIPATLHTTAQTAPPSTLIYRWVLLCLFCVPVYPTPPIQVIQPLLPPLCSFPKPAGYCTHPNSTCMVPFPFLYSGSQLLLTPTRSAGPTHAWTLCLYSYTF